MTTTCRFDLGSQKSTVQKRRSTNHFIHRNVSLWNVRPRHSPFLLVLKFSSLNFQFPTSDLLPRLLILLILHIGSVLTRDIIYIIDALVTSRDVCVVVSDPGLGHIGVVINLNLKILQRSWDAPTTVWRPSKLAFIISNGVQVSCNNLYWFLSLL